MQIFYLIYLTTTGTIRSLSFSYTYNRSELNCILINVSVFLKLQIPKPELKGEP